MSYIDGGRAEETTEHLPDQLPAAPWSTPARRTKNRLSVKLNPSLLAYLMGPAAFVTLVVLMHFGLVVREPIWVWALVFVAIPLSNLVVDGVYHHYPGWTGLNLRVAVQAAAVTAVIYLTGWGPVSAGRVRLPGPRERLRTTAPGSGGSPPCGAWSASPSAQVAIMAGCAPIRALRSAQANALAVMGAFVLVFIIRMAGATMEQKEKAEASHPSERGPLPLAHPELLRRHARDRRGGICTYVSPAVIALLGLDPDELVGHRATDLVHPDDRDRVRGPAR